ncbi:MAG: S8 family peptidase [Pseudomonadales bacterium]|nr:S8 family peptidase [Pseudomonadales bacterium]
MKSITITGMIVLALIAVGGAVFRGSATEAVEPVVVNGITTSFIVQAADGKQARAAVEAIGGQVVHELGIIKSVSALLTEAQRSALEADNSITVYSDEVARVEGWGGFGKRNDHTWRNKNAADPTQIAKKFFRHYSYLNGDDLEEQEFVISDALTSHFPVQHEAHYAQAMGMRGRGVTVAVLDSGIARTPWLSGPRLLAEFDATVVDGTEGQDRAQDDNGHGTHVASLIASAGKSGLGEYNAMAPEANLVAVKAFDENGMGSYADVIHGLDWILQNKDRLGIRIVNMSFGSPVQSYYWDDPLAQAVMVAWQQGLVVVASAGNAGPEPMTIGVPGNVPYVITVGAVTDSYTPHDATDDVLVSFSSSGPTFEAHVKPDIVAYGGHMLGLMASDATIAINHPEFQAPDAENYYLMSGTSQAAGVVSGAVALMLQMNPALSNNDVKCRLLSTAGASSSNVAENYTIFQQGAGMLNVHRALMSRKTGCANTAFDINVDIAGTDHFIGPARMDETGEFFIEGVNKNKPGMTWTGDYVRGVGYSWNNGHLWNNGFIWNNGFSWNNGYTWNNGFLWNNAYLWNNGSVETAGVDAWVGQE